MSSQSYIILLLLLLLKICCPAGARQLTAVSKRARIQTRDAAFKPYSAGFEFHYIDEDTIHANDQFAARLTFEPRLPVLAIEDVDRHLDMIQCSPDGLLLQFDSRRKLKKAEETWAALEEFVVVTSHLGCNHDGERQPYLVSRVSFKEAGPSAFLHAKPVAWKETFYSMTVDFGTSNGQFTPADVRKHDVLRRRKATPSSTISYPNTPSVVPSATMLSKDISSSYSGHLFPPIGGVSIGCKECSLSGTLVITHGSFTIKTPATQKRGLGSRVKGIVSDATGHIIKGIDHITHDAEQAGDHLLADAARAGDVTINDTGQVVDKAGHIIKDALEIVTFIDHGYIELEANGLGALIDLQVNVSASQQLANFTLHLADIPLTPFTIPGIASIGPSLDPQIIGSIDLTEKVGFSTGFQVTIPDGSNIILDFADITRSNSTGFSEAVVKTLPFEAEAEAISLVFSAAFHPELLLGIELLDVGEIGAGFFLDIPKVTVAVSQTQVGPDGNCIPQSSMQTIDINNITDVVLGSRTLISPTVTFDLGVDIQADVFLLREGKSFTLYTKSFPLETACVEWGSKLNSTSSATSPSAAASAPPTIIWLAQPPNGTNITNSTKPFKYNYNPLPSPSALGASSSYTQPVPLASRLPENTTDILSGGTNSTTYVQGMNGTYNIPPAPPVPEAASQPLNGYSSTTIQSMSLQTATPSASGDTARATLAVLATGEAADIAVPESSGSSV